MCPADPWRYVIMCYSLPKKSSPNYLQEWARQMSSIEKRKGKQQHLKPQAE